MVSGEPFDASTAMSGSSPSLTTPTAPTPSATQRSSREQLLAIPGLQTPSHVAQGRDCVPVERLDMADTCCGPRDEGRACQLPELAERVQEGQGRGRVLQPVETGHHVDEGHGHQSRDVDGPHGEHVVDVFEQQRPRPVVLATLEQGLDLGRACGGVGARRDRDVGSFEEAPSCGVDVTP